MGSRIAIAVLAIICAWPATADVLESIRTRGSIVLGVRADAPPFSYLNAETEPAGLAVRLCERVAEHLSNAVGLHELKVQHRIVNASGRFGALRRGLTDLHCGPASVTLSRRESLDFSLLYFVDGATIAARPESRTAVFDAKQGTFGVLDGTTAVPLVKSLVAREDIDAQIVPFASHPRGLRALRDGSIDVYIGDRSILAFQIGAEDLASDVLLDSDVLSFEPYALAVRGGERRLLLEVDRALSQIYASGEIFDMIEAEIGADQISDTARSIYQIVGLPD